MTNPQLYTIGYSRHSIEGLIALLRKYEIEVVVDVRTRPYGRNPDFNRELLQGRLLPHKIEYQFAGFVLGGIGPMPNVVDAKFQAKMEEILQTSITKRVALMCSEGQPCECHRALKLTAWLHQETGYEATHILPDGRSVMSRAYQPTIDPKAMWFEFGGDYGANKYPHMKSYQGSVS